MRKEREKVRILERGIEREGEKRGKKERERVSKLDRDVEVEVRESR